jgi:hypothetical protein
MESGIMRKWCYNSTENGNGEGSTPGADIDTSVYGFLTISKKLLQSCL